MPPDFTDQELRDIIQNSSHSKFETVKTTLWQKCYETILSATITHAKSRRARECFRDELIDALCLFFKNPAERLASYDSDQGDICRYILNIRNSQLRTLTRMSQESVEKEFSETCFLHSKEVVEEEENIQFNAKLFSKWKSLELPKSFFRLGHFKFKENKTDKNKALPRQKSYYLGSAYRHLSVHWEEPQHEKLKELCREINPKAWDKIPQTIAQNWKKEKASLLESERSQNSKEKQAAKLLTTLQNLEGKFIKKYRHPFYNSAEKNSSAQEKKDKEEILETQAKLENYQTKAKSISQETGSRYEKFYEHPLEPIQLQDLFNITQQDIYTYIKRYGDHFHEIFAYEDKNL